MAIALELRVVVASNSDQPPAEVADNLELAVTRALRVIFPPANVFIERASVKPYSSSRSA